jgi:hypothetical protein
MTASCKEKQSTPRLQEKARHQKEDKTNANGMGITCAQDRFLDEDKSCSSHPADPNQSAATVNDQQQHTKHAVVKRAPGEQE